MANWDLEYTKIRHIKGGNMDLVKRFVNDLEYLVKSEKNKKCVIRKVELEGKPYEPGHNIIKETKNVITLFSRPKWGAGCWREIEYLSKLPRYKNICIRYSMWYESDGFNNEKKTIIYRGVNYDDTEPQTEKHFFRGIKLQKITERIKLNKNEK